MRSIGDPVRSGRNYWELLSDPPYWFGNLVQKAKAADELPVEFIYDEARGRYPLEKCPPILTMTLPAMTDDPDSLYDELSGIVPSWESAPISDQSRRLFEMLATKYQRPLWIERSGLSYWYAPDILKGFPDSKYVHLTRDGRDVVLSMMNMRLFDPVIRFGWMISNLGRRGHLQTALYFHMRPFARRSLLALTDLERSLTGQHGRDRPYSLPDSLSEKQRVLAYAEFWARSTTLGNRAIQSVSPKNLLTVRYEDLVASPRDTLGAIIEFLRPGSDHCAWLNAVVDEPKARPSRWSTLDPEIAAAAEEIIAPVNATLGYR